MKKFRGRPSLLTVGQVGLSLAAGLAFLRLILRLLVADELSPVGRWLVAIGGVVVAPVRAIVRAAPVGQLPGATFEPATLAAGLIYLGLVAGLGLAGAWRQK